MNLARKFWTLTRWARAVRFWVFVVAVVASFFLGLPARASNSETREEAYAKCAVAKGASGPESRRIGSNECTRATSGNTNRYVCRYEVSPITGQTPPVYSTCGDHYWTVQCPADPPGLEWNESAKKCISPELCLQRNGAANGMPAVESVRPFSEKCVAGCQLKIEGGSSCTSIAGQAGSKMCAGVFQYSGNMCSGSPDDPDEPLPPESPESCEQVSNGQGGNSGVQVCKKKDGRECVSTKSGASICWGTHETGTKSANDEQQTRGPGTDEPTPTPPTPPETFDPGKKTDPVTTTTTTTNPNGSTTTTTTTTVTNGTTNGTQPPGTPVSGGGGSGNPGQGDDQEGTASGGGDCDTPPITTGDAVTGMVATQAWATRCAVEAGNAANVTGDVGDCAAPFSVEGTNANAEQLRALRASICGPEETQRHDVETMKDSVDELDAAIAAGESEFGESVLIESGEVPALSLTRFGGGGSCPIVSVAMPWGDTWEPPARFCDVIAALRLLFLAIATIWALRIIGDE